MNEINSTLNDFLINTKSSSVLIINEKGKLATAVHVDFQDSIAAMSAAILSMSQKFLTDLDKGSLKQLYLKSEGGVVIGNKISNSNFVIIFSKEGSNLGLLLRNVEELSTELSQNSLLK